MCGRLNIHDSEIISRLLKILGIDVYPVRPPRYNITPSALVDVVYEQNQTAPMSWGIEFGKFRHPNSKADTIKRKPFLQKLLLQQRCLVPVNRFYEWPDSKIRPKYQGVKTRFCIHNADNVLLLGGIYKISKHGELQFNVITTSPNAQINDFHHRMPVIIDTPNAKSWLESDNLESLYQLMSPYKNDLIIYPCSSFVDNGRNEGEQCMAPA